MYKECSGLVPILSESVGSHKALFIHGKLGPILRSYIGKRSKENSKYDSFVHPFNRIAFNLQQASEETGVTARKIAL